MQNEINQILRSPATVFTFKEILLASHEPNPILLKRRLHYYIKQGYLYSLRRGLYAKDRHYNQLEAATKIYTPSYVSFETILAEAGIIFQHYTSIFVATYKTAEIVCDEQKYSFRKIKNTILTNTEGIEHRGTYFAASKERAFLDILYLNKDYHFDNLAQLDERKVRELLPLYNNKRMNRVVYKKFKTLKLQESEQ